jgi:hypothetical protein
MNITKGRIRKLFYNHNRKQTLKKGFKKRQHKSKLIHTFRRKRPVNLQRRTLKGGYFGRGGDALTDAFGVIVDAIAQKVVEKMKEQEQTNGRQDATGANLSAAQTMSNETEMSNKTEMSDETEMSDKTEMSDENVEKQVEETPDKKQVEGDLPKNDAFINRTRQVEEPVGSVEGTTIPVETQQGQTVEPETVETQQGPTVEGPEGQTVEGPVEVPTVETQEEQEPVKTTT